MNADKNNCTKIIFIDDEILYQNKSKLKQNIKSQINEIKYNVIFCDTYDHLSSKKKAKPFLKDTESISLILLDHIIKNQNRTSINIIKEIRSINERIPIIIITGFPISTQELTSLFVNYGIDNFIRKNDLNKKENINDEKTMLQNAIIKALNPDCNMIITELKGEQYKIEFEIQGEKLKKSTTVGKRKNNQNNGISSINSVTDLMQMIIVMMEDPVFCSQPLTLDPQKDSTASIVYRFNKRIWETFKFNNSFRLIKSTYDHANGRKYTLNVSKITFAKANGEKQIYVHG